MMHMELEIRENTIYCDQKESDSNVGIAVLRAGKVGETWHISSSTHPDSEALNDFEASDQWIATSLLIGIARRLNNRILDGEG